MGPKAEEYFTISLVARQFDVHPQTLRVYEREGLLSPQRSRGNARLYSRADLERLRTILNLTRELGVNLAGVEVILRLKEQIETLKREKEEILRDLAACGRSGGPGKTLIRVRHGKPLPTR